MKRPLTDHEYQINGGAWIGCTLSNTTNNGDGTYTINDGLGVAIPIGSLKVRVKALSINPASTALLNTVAFNTSTLITPVITFNQPDDMVLASTDQPLTVSSSHDTPSVLLTSSDTSKATVFKTGTQWYLHVVAAGSFFITASQAAQTGYNAAVPVSRSVIIGSDGIALLPTDIYTTRGIPGGVIDSVTLQLQTDLQSAGLWDDLVALYGGVSKTGDLGYLFNLKNPIDSDAAFRAVPLNTPLDVNGDGIITSFDSLVVDSEVPVYSKALFIYKRNQNPNSWIMGHYGTGGDFAVNTSNNGFVNGNGIGGGDLTSGGLTILNVVSAIKYNLFLNGTKLSEGSPGGSNSSLSFAFNGLKTGGGISFTTDKAIGLAGVYGRGLSDSEAVVLNTISENYATALKRSYTQPFNKVYFYGDSITAGYLAAPFSNGWVNKLSALMGWDCVNQGNGGETITTNDTSSAAVSFLTRYTSVINTKTADDKYIFIAYGTNETVKDDGTGSTTGTMADYQDGITTVVDYAVTKGWSVDDIVLITGYSIGTLSSGQSARHADIIAAGEAVCVTLGITKYFNLQPDMLANGATSDLHPDTGMHAIMAIKVKKYLASVGINSVWD